MARILAIDTTTEFGSLALVEADRVLEEILLHSAGGFGHVLWDHLERLLARRGWTTADVDGFAAAAGPGSFTGVRIGLAALKGLAEAHGKPAAALSNLAAVAWFGTAPRRAVVLDARRGEVYGAVYGAAWEIIVPEVVSKFPEWLASLPEGDLELLSTDFSPFRAALAGTRFEHLPLREAPRALAGAIGVIAATRLAAGLAQDPAAIDANYVRRSDAELFWKDR
ncbi:MAG: tRNA (adenosine(37)-N6)-threonylcarbamoyltransferase complex dimerization subunit type 1 TsaB [Acidobacteria bacterium]|nr:tRNA (adenosine(37)-N6)-threonylcarbamoyltransferase complex dimerization subunit type 1 TsaB [Acidobacteriota bacterium]